MAGTKDLEEVVISGARLANLVKQLSNGVDLGDIDDAVRFVTTLPAAVDGIQNVPEQIEDLDDEERLRIDKLLDEYGIPPGKREEAFHHFSQGAFHIAQGALILKG